MDSEEFFDEDFNYLILERIFNFLPFKDLKTTALVNKQWYYMSRLEIRRNRACYAKITNDQPCQQLLRLAEKFETTPKPCVTGLSLDLTYIPYENCPDATKILETNTTLKKLPIKYLKIKIQEDSQCLAAQLVKYFVKERGGEIQELAVDMDEPVYWGRRLEKIVEFFKIDPSQTNWLPNLVEFKFLEKCDSDIFLEFVQAAPRIQRISGCIDTGHLFDLLPANKAQFVTEFTLDSVSERDAEEVIRFAELEPKIRKLRMCWQSDVKEMWLSVVMIFLDSTYLHLKKLELDHFDLILLASSERICLLNLQHLVVHFNDRLDRQLGFFSMSKIKYDFVFPNLELTEFPHSSELRGYKENLLSLLPDHFIQSEELFSSSKVVHVKISNNCFDINPENVGQNLTLIFPNVTILQVENCREIVSYLKYPLRMWRKLESLSVTFKENPIRATNFDALFCGISNEEWTSLRSSPSKKLRFKSILPSEASLIHLKNLKSLKLSIFHEHICSAVKCTEDVGLSYLSGRAVFSRMPDMSVDIVRNECSQDLKSFCRFRFKDLQKYARVLEANI